MPKEMVNELKILLEKDQQSIADFALGVIGKETWQQRVDYQTKRIKEILNSYGIARKNIEGEKAYKAMLILVLHSGDVKLVRNYLIRHKNTANINNVSISDRAVLVDKIAVMSGKLQKYGTQYKILNGRIEFLPISKEEKVDERRKLLRLGTLLGYRKKIEQSLKNKLYLKRIQ